VIGLLLSLGIMLLLAVAGVGMALRRMIGRFAGIRNLL